MAEHVRQVLREIDADTIPQILVFNKIDLTHQKARLERDPMGHVARVWVSAVSGDGIDLLRDAVAEHFSRQRVVRRVQLPPEAGRLHARIHERLHVVRESATEAGGWVIDVTLEPSDVAWLQRQDGFTLVNWTGDDSSVLAPTGS
jgi:GTP-binding protein HflX